MEEVLFSFLIALWFRHPSTVVIDINNNTSDTPKTDTPETQEEKASEKSPENSSSEKPSEKAPDNSPKTEKSPRPITTTATTARSTRSTIGARPARSRVGGKLGIKKAPIHFNFEEAEARAKEERERKAKLGISEEEQQQEQQEDRTISSRLTYQDPSLKQERKTEEEEQQVYEKLGFGMARMGISSSPSSDKARKVEEEEAVSAREKFGNAKAISSDQFFGRNEYDPAISAEQASRLAQFQGAKAISSDQYFGREPELDRSMEDTVSFGNDWDSLQDQALVMARKLVGQASADLDAVRDLAENATSKVCLESTSFY